MADLGDTLSFRADVYNKPAEDGGVLTNASTAVLTVTLPDGTTATPTVTNPATGKYAVDYLTTSASPQGRYVGQWVFTFAGGATTSYVETFDVGGALVTVDEALTHLRANGILNAETDLEQLQWLCFVATEAVERDLDRALVPQTVVETHDGGGSIVLHQSPVISITSVVESGATLTTNDYLIDSRVGILYRGSADYPRRFSGGFRNVVVTYIAGYANPPRVARKVALNLIQGMWQTAQQAPHPALTEYNDLDTPTAVAMLTPLERSAYDSLRAAAIA